VIYARISRYALNSSYPLMRSRQGLPARSAYSEMISAGRINLIPDTALRKRLAVHMFSDRREQASAMAAYIEAQK